MKTLADLTPAQKVQIILQTQEILDDGWSKEKILEYWHLLDYDLFVLHWLPKNFVNW